MSTTTMDVITDKVIENAYTYEEYRNMIDELLAEGKTTGSNHSDSMIHYTKMNAHRMNRLDKRSDLTDDLKAELDKVQELMIWLVLTEAWCGDAAQNLPVINKMAEYSDKIDLKLILRDENLAIMDQFLTNGKSRSIPKLISIDKETKEVLGSWGPRPATARELYDSLRNDENIPYQEVSEKLQKWYTENQNQEIQSEFAELLQEWQNR